MAVQMPPTIARPLLELVDAVIAADPGPDRDAIVTVDDLDLAFSTFYLNRTNRSGIIDGGPIGGHDQSGGWKVDARFNAEELAKRVSKIARFADRITVSGEDAASFLEPWTQDKRHALIYLDPPYTHEDHAEIARLVRRLVVVGVEVRSLNVVKSPWFVTYDAVPEILDMYQGY